MKVLVLLNVMAGSIKDSQGADVDEIVGAGLRERGITPEVKVVQAGEVTERARAFVEQAAGSRSDERTVLVAGGGDGTIGSIASALAGTNVTLGILPLGTLNHFAKDMGLPTDLEAALDVIAAGQTRSVDVAEVNGRIFVNNSSIGIYPFLVAERTAEQHRRGVGKLAAIGPALVRTLKASPWQIVKMSVGDRRELRTPCVFVGNNVYDFAAFGRRDTISAGRLCVYVVKPQTLLRLLLLPLRVAFGIVHAEHDVELFQVQSLEIHSRRRRLQVSVDGETASMATPLSYRIRPAALRVLVPVADGGAAR